MRNTRQRRQQIMEQLLMHGSVQVGDLVERYGVSAVTIRADLTHLEAQGLATRSHGGASLQRMPPQEHDIHEKDVLNLPLKETIGAQAAQLGTRARLQLVPHPVFQNHRAFLSVWSSAASSATGRGLCNRNAAPRHSARF